MDADVSVSKVVVLDKVNSSVKAYFTFVKWFSQKTFDKILNYAHHYFSNSEKAPSGFLFTPTIGSKPLFFLACLLQFAWLNKALGNSDIAINGYFLTFDKLITTI